MNTSPATAQIVVENLCKTFRVAERAPGMWGALAGLVRRRHRNVRALHGVSFSIEKGELVGYVGPNGAGKSTTAKVLAGILVPDSGRCEIDGRVPWKRRVEHVARIGVVFGQRTQLWTDLPVAESFARGRPGSGGSRRSSDRRSSPSLWGSGGWVCDTIDPPAPSTHQENHVMDGRVGSVSPAGHDAGPSTRGKKRPVRRA